MRLCKKQLQQMHTQMHAALHKGNIEQKAQSFDYARKKIVEYYNKHQ